MSYEWYINRYQILNPRGIKGVEDPKKASKILIESTELDEDLYRLGHTKARLSSILSCFLAYWAQFRNSSILYILSGWLKYNIYKSYFNILSIIQYETTKREMPQTRQRAGIFRTPQQQKQQHTHTQQLQLQVDTLHIWKCGRKCTRCASKMIDLMIQFHSQLSNPESRWHRWCRGCQEVWRSYIGIHHIGSRYVSYWTH